MTAKLRKDTMVWKGCNKNVSATMVSDGGVWGMEAFGTVNFKPFIAEIDAAEYGFRMQWHIQAENLTSSEVKSLRIFLGKMFHDIVRQNPDWNQTLCSDISDMRDNDRRYKEREVA